VPTFTYEAKDGSGNAVSGLIEAMEERGAASALREQGLWPTRLALSHASGANAVPILREPGTSNSYRPAMRDTQPERVDAAPFLVAVPLPILAMMYRQMATLANAGVPLVQALGTLSQQTRNGRLKSILLEAAGYVASGNPFSGVMQRYPAVFSQFQVEMIRAGEASGAIEAMCSRIATYLEREIDIRRKLQRETLYPKIVLFVAGCVLVLLGFLKSGAQGALGPVKFTGEVGGAAFAIWWLVRYMNQFPAFGATFDRIKMLVPGTGWVARKYATARFCRALGSLYSAGIMLPTAVGIAARACGNRAIGEQMESAVPFLMAGNGLSGMLAKSGLLSPIAIQMAQTGEQTGGIDIMMDKVADYLEDEADLQANQMAKFAGVGAILLAACVVIYIAVSFYSGYFNSMLHEGEGGEN